MIKPPSGWRDLNSRPLTPDIGSVSKDVPRRPVLLKNKDSALRRISVDNTNGGQMVIRPIAKLSEEA
jgi:hypothetical protein